MCPIILKKEYGEEKMKEQMKKRDRVTLAIFVFVTITAGGYGYLLDQVLTEQPEGNSLGMGLWLVLPCLTGVILQILNTDLKQIGFRVGRKNNYRQSRNDNCSPPRSHQPKRKSEM